MNDPFEEITLSSETIFTGRIISLQVDQVKLPNGKTAAREIVKHPGAVGILAIDGDHMIVVEQYRKAMEKSQIEIPAGKLEAGEEPEQAAMRELQEETGFHCDALQHISSFYTSPGFSNEILHLYAAVSLVKGQQQLDHDEFLQCSRLTLEQARQFIRDGRISDAKTVAAVYVWQIYSLTGRF